MFGEVLSFLHRVLSSCYPSFGFSSTHSGEMPVELPKTNRRPYRKMMIPAVVLVVLSVLYGVGTEWLIPYMTDASDVLLQPSIYIDAVLKE